MSTKRKPPAKPSAKRKRGRPSKFTPELTAEILQRISHGESLHAICRDPAMPAEITVRDWLTRDEDFSTKYARAREEQAERYAAEIVEIADTCDDPNKARLQIDARKWYASKVAPKKFGEKLDVEHSGGVSVKVTIGGGSA